MNRHHFLQALKQQLALLVRTVAPLADKQLACSHFDRKIFQSHDTRLRDYLNEVG
ncbi:MAG: primosomal replication protein PriC [Candidatus Malihini olakiniferum]